MKNPGEKIDSNELFNSDQSLSFFILLGEFRNKEKRGGSDDY